MKNFIKFLFCKLLFRVKYYNLENLKKYNKFLICPNHSTIFDPFFIYPMIDNLFIMAKSEIFKNKLFSKILKHYNVFPVNRNKVDINSLLKSFSVFKHNNSCKLLIFPEGGVIKNKDDIGKKYHNGPTFISSKLHIPIVPVFITRRPRFFSKVDVILGTPYFVDNNLKDKAELKQQSKNLIDKIYNLKDKPSD